jgi:hypothetical protein
VVADMSTVPVAVPHHRNIVAVDIEDSTARTNTAKGWLRHVMYDLFEAALQASGILEEHMDALIDRGDGVLALIYPVNQAPKTLLLNTFVPTLGRLLGEHNSQSPLQLLRMRAAVHAGEVHYDGKGIFGEALDITFRLLDAPEVKSRLSETRAPLVLVVSDDIYRSVVRHCYEGIDRDAFQQLVRLRVAGEERRGWVCDAA